MGHPKISTFTWQCVKTNSTPFLFTWLKMDVFITHSKWYFHRYWSIPHSSSFPSPPGFVDALEVSQHKGPRRIIQFVPHLEMTRRNSHQGTSAGCMDEGTILANLANLANKKEEIEWNWWTFMSGENSPSGCVILPHLLSFSGEIPCFILTQMPSCVCVCHRQSASRINIPSFWSSTHSLGLQMVPTCNHPWGSIPSLD